MTTLNISLSEEPLLRLQELAREAGIAPEEFLRESVERWLVAKPPVDFEQAAAYVFRKNAELYRRFSLMLSVSGGSNVPLCPGKIQKTALRGYALCCAVQSCATILKWTLLRP